MICISLQLILRGLRSNLGMWRLDAPRAVLVYSRIGRIFGQIELMLTRFRAGKLRRAGHRMVTPRQTPRDRRKPVRVMSGKFGWLVVAGRHEAACYGSQLQTVLNNPEMQAMLASSPQAVRILRPLCRALAFEVPGHEPQPRPKPDPKPRMRKPRPKPEPFRIPLPRGAITWARREGYGRIR